MARQPTDYGPVAAAHIEASAQLGKTAKQVTHELNALGIPIPQKTTERRLRDLRGQSKPRVSSKVTARRPLPGKGLSGSPDPLPATASDSSLPVAPLEAADTLDADDMITAVQAEANAAKHRNDMATYAALTRLVVTLLEHKRKATPPPAPDPNANPDLIAYGAQVEERFVKLLNEWTRT